MKKQPFFYSIVRENPCNNWGTQYAHAKILVYRVPSGDYHSGSLLLFSVRWQSDSDQEAKWYVPHIEISTQNVHPDEIARTLGEVRSILTKHPITWDAREWAKSIESSGIVRRVFDCRLDQWVELADVLPANVHKWIVRVDGHCVIDALGEDEEEARKNAVKKFGSMISNPSGFYGSANQFARQLSEWMAARQPIEKDTRNTAPEIEKTETILNPLGRVAEPTVEPAVAAA